MKHFYAPEEARRMRCCQGNIIYCLADTCMAWRWKPKEIRWVKEGTDMSDEWVQTNNPDSTVSIGGSETDRKFIEYEKKETEQIGYCGLARVPSVYD